MPFCVNCGTELTEGRPDCQECGHPAPRASSARPPSDTSKTDGGAIASLVLGIVGFLIPFVASIIALVLGIRAQMRISDDPERGGGGFAVAGIVTGGVGLVWGFMLIAIAVPTFLGARERAQDRAAQSSARNALTAAKVLYTYEASYEPITAGDLGALEPSLHFVDGGLPSTGPRSVSFAVVTADQFRVAVRSESGTCFGAKDEFGVGTTFAAGETVPFCSALTIPAQAYGPEW